MAFTVTARGNTAENSSDTSFGIVPSGNLSAGPRSFAILFAEWDNSDTAGADPFSSVTDTKGNTWTQIARTLQDPGAANAGLVAGAFYTDQAVGTLTTSDTVTLTLTTNTAIKCLVLVELNAASGFQPEFVPGSSSAVVYTNTTGGTRTSGTINVGEVVFGYTGIEHSAALTADSDATNGSWASQVTSTAGSTTSGGRISVQWKIQTTTSSTQTYNTVIGGTNHDGVIGIFTFREVAHATASPGAVTPTVTCDAPTGGAGGTTGVAVATATVLQASASGGGGSATGNAGVVVATATLLTLTGGAGGTTSDLARTVTTLTPAGGASGVAGVVVATIPFGGGSASVTFDAATAGGSPALGSNTLTFAHTIGSGSDRLLVVTLGYKEANIGSLFIPPTSVKYNGVDLTLARNDECSGEGGQWVGSSIYYLLHADLPTAGTYNVVVVFGETMGDFATPPGDTNFCNAAVSAVSVTGAAQGAPEAVDGSNTTTDLSSIDASVTTITPNAWVFGVAMGSSTSGRSYAPASGQTERTEQALTGPGGYTSTNTLLVATPGLTANNVTVSGGATTRQAATLAVWAPAAVAAFTLTGGAGGITADQSHAVALLAPAGGAGGTTGSLVVTVFPQQPTGSSGATDATGNAGVVVATASVLTPAGGASALAGVVVAVAPMQHGWITHDASSYAATIVSATTSWSHTIGSGADRMLLVGVGSEVSSTTLVGDVASVTYNGVALTRAASTSTLETVTENAELWYLGDPNLPAAGTYTVVVTTNNTTTTGCSVIGGAVSLAGVKRAAPEQTATFQSNVDATLYTNTTSTLTDRAWVVDAFGLGIGQDATHQMTTWDFTGQQVERVSFSDNALTGTTAGSSVGMSTSERATPSSVDLKWATIVPPKTPTSGGWTMTRYAQAVASFASAPQFTLSGGAGGTTGDLARTVALLAPVGGAGGTTGSLLVTVFPQQPTATAGGGSATGNAGVVVATATVLTPNGGASALPGAVLATVTGPGAAPTNPSASAFNIGGGANSFSYTIGGGANRLLVVIVTAEDGSPSFTTPTYNGVAMQVGPTFTVTEASSFDRVSLYYMLDAALPAAGSYTLSCTITSGNGGGMSAHQFAGVGQAAPEATTQDGTTVDQTNYDSTITTVSAGALVVSAIYGGTIAGGAYNQDAPLVELSDNQDTGGRQAVAYFVAGAAGSQALGWDATGSAQARQAHVAAAWATPPGVPLTGGAGGTTGTQPHAVALLAPLGGAGGTTQQLVVPVFVQQPDAGANATANAGVVVASTSVLTPNGGAGGTAGVAVVTATVLALPVNATANAGVVVATIPWSGGSALAWDVVWGGFNVTSNRPVSTSGDNVAILTTGAIGYQRVKATYLGGTIDGGSAPGQTSPGLAVRYTGTGGGSGWWTLYIENGNAGLYDGPAFSGYPSSPTLGSFFAVSPGDTVELEASGTTLKVFKNGSLVATHNSVSINTTGAPGMYCGGNPYGFDDFEFTNGSNVWTDNFNRANGDLDDDALTAAGGFTLIGGAGGVTTDQSHAVTVLAPPVGTGATANAGVVAVTVATQTPTGGAGGTVGVVTPTVAVLAPTVGAGATAGVVTPTVIRNTPNGGAGGTTGVAVVTVTVLPVVQPSAVANAGVVAVTVTPLTPAGGAGGTTGVVAAVASVLALAGSAVATPGVVTPTVIRNTMIGGAGGTTTSLLVVVNVLTVSGTGGTTATAGIVVATVTTNGLTGGAGGTTLDQRHDVTVLAPSASASATASPSPVVATVVMRTPVGGAGGTTQTLPITVFVPQLPSAGGAVAGIVGVGVSTLTPAGGAGGTASEPASTTTLPAPGGGSAGSTVALAVGVGAQIPAGGAGGTTQALVSAVTVLAPAASASATAQAGIVAVTAVVQQMIGGAGGTLGPVVVTVHILLAALFTGHMPGGVVVGVGGGPGATTDTNGPTDGVLVGVGSGPGLTTSTNGRDPMVHTSTGGAGGVTVGLA